MMHIKRNDSSLVSALIRQGNLKPQSHFPIFKSSMIPYLIKRHFSSGYNCSGFKIYISLLQYFSGAPAARRTAKQSPISNPYGKQKETHVLIFSWLSWLAVLLVGSYARRRRRRRRRRWSRARWLPYSK